MAVFASGANAVAGMVALQPQNAVLIVNIMGELLAARERLAALPKPVDFDQVARRFKAAYGFDLEWPANLTILDGFIACFDRPDNEAYGACAAAAEKAAAGRH